MFLDAQDQVVLTRIPCTHLDQRPLQQAKLRLPCMLNKVTQCLEREMSKKNISPAGLLSSPGSFRLLITGTGARQGFYLLCTPRLLPPHADTVLTQF